MELCRLFVISESLAPMLDRELGQACESVVRRKSMLAYLEVKITYFENVLTLLHHCVLMMKKKSTCRTQLDHT